MFALATLVAMLIGGGLVLAGARRYFRGRPARRPPRTGRQTALDVALVTSGGVLLLAPELPADLLGLSAGGSGAGAFLLAVAHILALIVMLVLVGAMVLVSQRVVAPALETADRVAARMPSLRGGQARRQVGLADFPRDWAGLLAYEQSLSRRFLAYDHDLELAVSLPAMRDYTEPATRGALRAMFACDAERRESAPPLTADVITTGFGRAVAAFALALQQAEDNARRLAAAGLADDEGARVGEAATILAFVRTNSTTAAERDEAYRTIADLLNRPRERTGAPQTPGQTPTGKAQPHPWLDVRQRADLHRLTN